MRIVNITNTSLYLSFVKHGRSWVKSLNSNIFPFNAITDDEFRKLFSRGMIKVCFDKEDAQYLQRLLDSNAEEAPNPDADKTAPVDEVVKPVDEVVKPVDEVVKPVDEVVKPAGAPVVDEADKSSFEEIQGFMGGLTSPQPKPNDVEPDLGSLNTENKDAEKPEAKQPAKKKAGRKKKDGNK